MNIQAGAFTGSAHPWETLPALAVIQPCLVIIDHSINAWNFQTPVATLKADYRLVIDAARAAGADVLLQISIPPNVNAASGVSGGLAPISPELTLQRQLLGMEPYRAAILDLAIEKDVACIDMIPHFPGGYTQVAAMNMITDSVHPRAEGQWDIAGKTATVLQRVT